MDTRQTRLPVSAIEVLGSISYAGTLHLRDIDVDDFMSLGGHGLIAVRDDTVSLTERGSRFLATKADDAHVGHSSH